MSLKTTPLAIIGGAGLGLLAMYLLDPEQGEARRRRLAHLSSQAKEQAKELGQKISEHVEPHEIAALGGRLRDEAFHRARSFAQSRLAAAECPSSFTKGITLAGAGAMALGAGMMYLLDPSQGHDRRQAVIRSVGDAVVSVGSTCRSVGQFVRHQFDRLGSRGKEESAQESGVKNESPEVEGQKSPVSSQ